ncbi:MAG TPA: hypothetical protein VIL77_10125 [Gaiellaceae bacterium]
MALIDDVLPHYDVHEVHSIASVRSIEDALAMPVAADPFVRLLLRLRGMGGRGTIGDLFGGMRFDELARSETEIVFGGAGTPWRRGGGMRPFADAQPGTVRIAANFLSDGNRLSTETRVEAVDDAARRAFLRYWRVVGPFSAAIRRRWLRQIAG